MASGEEWVLVEDETQLLYQCWKSLPTELTFEEFATSIRQARARKKSWVPYFESFAWYLQIIGLCSSYAATAVTMIQYREALWLLWKWYLG